MEQPKKELNIGKVAGFLAIGTYFGIVLVKSEVVSWFRIQEMFRFDSFHMYGTIGSAITVAALSLAMVRRLNLNSSSNSFPDIAPKKWEQPGLRYVFGGILFGFGWALLGACPGPIYALVGSGVSVMIVAVFAATIGAFTYGRLQKHLPH